MQTSLPSLLEPEVSVRLFTKVEFKVSRGTDTETPLMVHTEKQKARRFTLLSQETECPNYNRTDSVVDMSPTVPR